MASSGRNSNFYSEFGRNRIPSDVGGYTRYYPEISEI
jgi:hypothetical protein